MRRLLLVLGLATMTASLTPSSAATAAVHAPLADLPARVGVGLETSATGLQAYKNKKIDLVVAEIARAERGEDLVYVRIQTTKPNMQCHMRVKFADGSVAQPPRVTADETGGCILHFDVPDRSSVIGLALMKVDILNKRGQERAKLVQDFAVFDD